MKSLKINELLDLRNAVLLLQNKTKSTKEIEYYQECFEAITKELKLRIKRYFPVNKN